MPGTSLNARCCTFSSMNFHILRYGFLASFLYSRCGLTNALFMVVKMSLLRFGNLFLVRATILFASFVFLALYFRNDISIFTINLNSF